MILLGQALGLLNLLACLSNSSARRRSLNERQSAGGAPHQLLPLRRRVALAYR